MPATSTTQGTQHPLHSLLFCVVWHLIYYRDRSLIDRIRQRIPHFLSLSHSLNFFGAQGPGDWESLIALWRFLFF